MTDQNHWKELDGGLNIAVTQYDKTNPNHRQAVRELFAGAVGKVAAVHGAAFSEAGFRNVIRFLDSGDIKAEFYEAAWDVCRPKMVGGAFFYNAIGIDKSGKPRRGRYLEDEYLSNEKLRELVREKPVHLSLPTGLGASYQALNLDRLRKDNSEGVIPQFLFGEFDLANTRMVRGLKETGAILGDPSNSRVLEYKGIPEIVREKMPMVVYKTDLFVNGIYDPNNFIVNWRDKPDWLVTSLDAVPANGVDIAVSRGFTTAGGGRSVAQMRPYRVGNLPNDDVLDCVLASLVKRAEQEIKEVRHWGVLPYPIDVRDNKPASSTLNANPDVLVALLEACAREVVHYEAGPGLAFGGPMIDSHIHVLNDNGFLNSFRRLDANDRVFGDCLMMPGTNHLFPEADNDNDAQRPASNNNTAPIKLTA